MVGNPTELCFWWKILKYWLNLSLVAIEEGGASSFFAILLEYLL